MGFLSGNFQIGIHSGPLRNQNSAKPEKSKARRTVSRGQTGSDGRGRGESATRSRGWSKGGTGEDRDRACYRHARRPCAKLPRAVFAAPAKTARLWLDSML